MIPAPLRRRVGWNASFEDASKTREQANGGRENDLQKHRARPVEVILVTARAPVDVLGITMSMRCSHGRCMTSVFSWLSLHEDTFTLNSPFSAKVPNVFHRHIPALTIRSVS